MKLLAKHVKYDLLKYKNALLAVLIGSGVIEMAHIIAYLTEFTTLTESLCVQGRIFISS